MARFWVAVSLTLFASFLLVPSALDGQASPEFGGTGQGFGIRWRSLRGNSPPPRLVSLISKGVHLC